RPPVRLEMVPPVATSRTRGTSCACAADETRSAKRATPSAALLRRGTHVRMKRIQVPIEKRPDAVPRVALFPRILRLPGLRIHTAIEGVASRRVVVDHRFGQRRLA